MKSLSLVRLFATPWTIAYRAPPSMGFFQARVVEWVAISFSRGPSRPRARTLASRIVGRRFTVWATREAPQNKIIVSKSFCILCMSFAKTSNGTRLSQCFHALHFLNLPHSILEIVFGAFSLHPLTALAYNSARVYQGAAHLSSWNN